MRSSRSNEASRPPPVGYPHGHAQKDSRSSSITLDDSLLYALQRTVVTPASHQPYDPGYIYDPQKSPLELMTPMELRSPNRVREPSPADGCPLMPTDYWQSGTDEEPAFVPVTEYLSSENKHEDRLMRLSLGRGSSHVGSIPTAQAGRELLRDHGSCPGPTSTFSTTSSDRSDHVGPMTPSMDYSSPSSGSSAGWGRLPPPGYLQVTRHKRPSPQPTYMSPTKYQKLSSSDGGFSHHPSTNASSLSLRTPHDDGHLHMRHQYLDERLRRAGFDGLGGYGE